MTIQSRVGRILIITTGFALMLLVIFIARVTVEACTPPPPPADWAVTDAQTCTSTTIQLTGDLIIKNGGLLHLEDSTLEFQTTADGEFGSYVRAGGLWTSNSDSTVTSIGGFAHTLQVYDGGTLTWDNTTVSNLGYYVANTSRYGLQADDGSDILLDNLTYNNADYDGVRIFGDGATVKSSTFSVTNTAIRVGYTSESITIQDNTFTGGEEGVRVDRADWVNVTGNTFTDQTDSSSITVSGAGADDAENIMIRGNTITGNTNDNVGGVFCAKDHGIMIGTKVTDVTVRNNDLDGNDYNLRTSVATTISGNTFTNSAWGCCLSTNTDIASLDNNSFSFNNYHLIIQGLATSINDTYTNATYYDHRFPDSASHYLTLLNSTYDQGGASFDGIGPYFYVEWFLDVKVLDANGNPVAGATVTAKDGTGQVQATGITTTTGWARWLIVPDLNLTDTYTDFQPYTIEATKEDKEGEVQVNISGASRSIILQITSLEQKRSVHVNLFNAYNGLGLFEELLVLEFSLDGVNWTRSDSKDLDLEYVWGGTIQLRLKDFYNVTVSTVSLDMDSPTAPATDPEGITRQGVSEIFWDASIPILTINVDPPYDLNDWILELDGVEVGFFKEGTKIQIKVLGGLKGDQTHLYTLRWPKQPIIIDNKTVNVSAGEYNITAEGDETRKIGHISIIPPMKLAPDYEATKPAKSSEYSFRDFLQEYWLTVASMIIAVIVGFIGFLRYKQAKRTNELLGDDAGGGD